MAKEADLEKDKETPVAAEEKASGEGKSMKIYIGIFAIQILFSLGLLFFVILPILDGKPAAEASETKDAEEAASDANTLKQTFKVSDLTVNPKNSMGKRFAIFEVVLSVADEETIATLKSQEPVLRDRYINYFRSKTIAELSVETVMQDGRKDLTEIANDVIGGSKILDVFFTRFVLQ